MHEKTWRALCRLSIPPLLVIDHARYSPGRRARSKRAIANGRLLRDAYAIITVCGVGVALCYARRPNGRLRVVGNRVARTAVFGLVHLAAMRPAHGRQGYILSNV